MGLTGHASPDAVLGVSIAFTIVAAAAFGFRVLGRVAIARNAGLDDLFISFAMLFSIATTITMILQVKYGMGQHQDSIGADMFMSQLKAFYVSIWVYNLSLSCTKVSILLQYLRIFPQRQFRLCAYTLLGVVVVYSLYTFFTAIFTCTPIRYFWDLDVEGGRCLNRFAVWFANSGINIGTDILAAALPLPVLNQLDLPKRQKRALMFVFGLAGFACVAAVLRLPALYVISKTTNISWENPMAAIWSSVEMNTALTCSCLPTIRVVFPRIFKHQYSFSISRDSADNASSKCGPRFPSIKVSRVKNSVSHGHPKENASSLEEFGRSLDKSGKMAEQKSSCVRSQETFNDDIELDDYGALREHTPPDRIRVLTAIEQEIEIGRRDGSVSESTRDLV